MTVIQETYQIDETTSDNLVLAYHTHYKVVKTGQIKRKLMKLTPYQKGPVLGNRKIKIINKEGELEECALCINDLDLRVHNEKGTFVEKDMSCDSECMLTHIREIGDSLQNKTYSFLLSDVPITLFMDNAGGHGKIVVKEQYEKILKDKFNVIIEWQVPQSPKPTCWIWVFGCPYNQW